MNAVSDRSDRDFPNRKFRPQPFPELLRDAAMQLADRVAERDIRSAATPWKTARWNLQDFAADGEQLISPIPGGRSSR